MFSYPVGGQVFPNLRALAAIGKPPRDFKGLLKASWIEGPHMATSASFLPEPLVPLLTYNQKFLSKKWMEKILQTQRAKVTQELS